MAKFMVISFDSDEAQIFYDFVEAPAGSLAMEIVARARDYANVMDACRVEDIERFARDLKADKDTPTTAMELARQLADGFEEDEWCKPCDCRADDCVVDHGNGCPVDLTERRAL